MKLLITIIGLSLIGVLAVASWHLYKMPSFQSPEYILLILILALSGKLVSVIHDKKG